MTRRTTAWGGFRLILAALALVSQLALGALVLPDTASASAAAALDAASILCTTRQHTPGPLPHHRAADPAMCPLSISLALPDGVTAPPALLPPRRVSVVAWAGFTALPRGPPAAGTRPNNPRAPPVLS